MRRSEIKYLNQHIDFLQFLHTNRIEATQVGSKEVSLHCLSGKHEDKKPSFCFDYIKNIGFCHGCQTTFDAVGYIKTFYGFQRLEEVQQLFEHIRPGDRERILLNAIEAGTSELMEILLKASKLKKKIMQWNGSLPARTKLHAMLINKARPLSKEIIEQFDLRFDIRNRRVGIPIVFQGQTMGIQWRNFNKDEDGKYYIVQGTKIKKQAKYYIEAGTPKASILFGWDLAKDEAIKRNELLVVEGAYCTMSAVEKGFPNTVATLGACLSETQAALIKSCVSNVVFCYDDDAAGREGVIKAMVELGEGVSVKVVPLLNGRDVYDMSKEEFMKLYNEAKNEEY